MKSVNWKTWKVIGAENKSRVRGIKWKKDRLFWILQAVNILRKYIGGLEIHFIFPTFLDKIMAVFYDIEKFYKDFKIKVKFEIED